MTHTLPSSSEIGALREQCQRVIQTRRTYSNKLSYEQGIVDALKYVAGGDRPLPELLTGGDLEDIHEKSQNHCFA